MSNPFEILGIEHKLSASSAVQEHLQLVRTYSKGIRTQVAKQFAEIVRYWGDHQSIGAYLQITLQ